MASQAASTSQPPQSSVESDQHRHHRRFIGPMPEKVFSGTELPSRRKKRKPWLSAYGFSGEQPSEEDESVKDVIKAHAYQFFIGHGGKDEDWSSDKEIGVREEMFLRWRQSDWRKHRVKEGGSKWVGSSFEVGNFLGVNILEPGRVSTSSASEAVAARRPFNTFVTAPSHHTTSFDQRSGSDGSASQNNQRSFSVTSSPALLHMGPTGSQDRAIDQTRPGVISRHPATTSLLTTRNEGSLYRSALLGPRGKGKQVHYSDAPSLPESIPASPTDVLARTGSAVDDTSAGVADAACKEDQSEQDNLIMKDRMLVRVSYTNADSVGVAFDENKNRTTHHLEYEDWAEFLVVWRKKRLELYQDYSIPGREWIAKHKRLAFLVPLGDNQRTKLSLYSFVDLSFCLVCPPTAVNGNSKMRLTLHRAKPGLNIFVFKVKSRSRAQDWMWKLWCHLGGHCPSSIEIRCPALDTRIKVDIPDFDPVTQSNCGIFTRDNVVELCHRSLRTVRDYEWLLQKAVQQGRSLELAWRMETKLDWVWQLHDVQGKPRDWAVLYGLSLKQSGKPAHLEVRLQQHNPLKLHLKDGTRLDEPIAIEGYLDRIKPNTQTKQPIYLATHDGYLFSMSPRHAFPPTPPGIPPAAKDQVSLREAETRRGCKQILEATGVSDLRSIVAIRRAFQILPTCEAANIGRSGLDEVGLWEHIERNDSDDEDHGGEDGLARFSDKARQRVKRSFELMLTTGHVIRFEAHSCLVALEWIHRLRALVTYWKKRHQVDAKEEMDLAYSGTGKLRLTPLSHVHAADTESAPEAPPDPDASLPNLSSIYSWCIIKGCRPILKCGKLFVRKGLRGQYKHVQLVLVAGHLIQYRIKPTLSLHYRKLKTINLIDAYICSGYFAAQALPEGQFNPDAPPLARRYQDGLETEDPEEDTLFMIWYRPQPVAAGDEVGQSVEAQLRDSRGTKNAATPPLSAKGKIALFRTRSKLERDTWCWALNTEVEKIARANPEREGRLRDTGEIIQR